VQAKPYVPPHLRAPKPRAKSRVRQQESPLQQPEADHVAAKTARDTIAAVKAYIVPAQFQNPRARELSYNSPKHQILQPWKRSENALQPEECYAANSEVRLPQPSPSLSMEAQPAEEPLQAVDDQNYSSPSPATPHQISRSPAIADKCNSEWKAKVPPHLQRPASQSSANNPKPSMETAKQGVEVSTVGQTMVAFRDKTTNYLKYNRSPPSKDQHHRNGTPNKSPTHKIMTPAHKGNKPESEGTPYQSPLVGWDGKFAPAPIGSDWTRRDRTEDPNDKDAALRAWAEDLAADAADPSGTQIDVTSEEFQNGQGIAAGYEGLEKPIDEIDHIAYPANEPFTRVRGQKTTEDSIKENAARLEAMKKEFNEDDGNKPRRLSKEERRRILRQMEEEERFMVYPPNPYAPEANIFLRPVEDKDLPQISEIWNHYVKTSAAVAQMEPGDVRSWRDEMQESLSTSNPFIVAVLMDKDASRLYRDIRRRTHEHIVGFARSADYGARSNAYRYTVELEVVVKMGHLRQGVGKTMLDRLLAVLDIGYSLKEGAPLIIPADDNLAHWMGGGRRSIKTILFSILHEKDDQGLEWKKEWLKRNGFEATGTILKIGYKFDKQYVIQEHALLDIFTDQRALQGGSLPNVLRNYVNCGTDHVRETTFYDLTRRLMSQGCTELPILGRKILNNLCAPFVALRPHEYPQPWSSTNLQLQKAAYQISFVNPTWPEEILERIHISSNILSQPTSSDQNLLLTRTTGWQHFHARTGMRVC